MNKFNKNLKYLVNKSATARWTFVTLGILAVIVTALVWGLIVAVAEAWWSLSETYHQVKEGILDIIRSAKRKAPTL